MKTKIILLMLTLICVAAALCSCGPEVVSSYINDNNEIVAVYDDGTEAVIGTTVTIKGTKVDENFHVVVEYSDGTTEDLGYVGVIDEKLNVEVEKTTVNDEFHVIIEFTNGTTKDLGYVGVIDPAKNVEVDKTEVNEQFHLIVTFTDGTTKDMGYVGVIDPAKNVEVQKTTVNDEFHLIVTFTDGTTKDMGYVGVIDPAKNVEVAKTTVNDQFHLILTFTDGSTKDMGYVGTIDPSKNVEVEKTVVNEQFHLIVTFTNGTTKDMGYVGTIDPSKNVEVEKTTVDENYHLIVTFTDGTTKDMGYVAVEPPLYTVTFVDRNGNTLSVQEVYRGKAAKAPEAPEVTDMVFAGWDVDFTNVQGNIIVKATYTRAAEYTVTFKDADGTVLKTQTVISGRGATAPTPPKKADVIFIGWDISFNNVKSDLIVTAQYRQKNTYTVTFKDYSGLLLGTASVKEGDTAQAPVTPGREGYTFTGWSSSLSNVTSNKTVTAQYRLNSGNNVLDVSYKINSNNTVTVTFAVTGTVKFCGLEGYVDIPAGLKFESLTQGDGATANFADGKIYFMFASNNGQNVTKTTTLMTVTFSYSGDFSAATLNTVVSDIYDQNYVNMTCTVVGGEIKVK